VISALKPTPLTADHCHVIRILALAAILAATAVAEQRSAAS
jgi:hypothetical protein